MNFFFDFSDQSYESKNIHTIEPGQHFHILRQEMRLRIYRKYLHNLKQKETRWRKILEIFWPRTTSESCGDGYENTLPVGQIGFEI